MRAIVIRRLLVFGVCLVGVGCLHLGFGMPGPSSRVGTAPRANPLAHAELLAQPPPSTGSATPPYGSRRWTPARTARATATAADPGRDGTPPEGVGRLSLAAADATGLTVTWPAAGDDVGVVGYRVSLNGFPVLTTQRTRATLAWFNDTNTHVVQVRALDAAGNAGAPSPTLLIVRPSPTPTDGASPDTNIADPSPSAAAEGGTEEDGSR